ncbi:unnamed protein product [Mytilus coruscus]|uniref:C1q domain-containing protein n=1 Tax=Mytilus coruscus TaxID=42192 RepID=A0A6J8BCM4_MYTCO|nr:unnamed protein product [Mytilus coruscus]
MICYSNATLDELESRMNVKFQNMDALLREQNERIRNLENTENIQKVEIIELTGELDKRLLPINISTTPTSSRTVAFYAQMSKSDSNMGQHQTLVFDVVKTNINGGNGGYSAFSGIFTFPFDGIYVFTISLRIKSQSFGSYVITKNGDSEGTFVGILEGANVHSQVAGTIVITASQGDIVFVKTHPTLSHKGEVVNDANGESTFTGWLI